MNHVDFLLTNAIILTMDENMQIFEPGALAVNEGLIIAVGLEAEIRKEFSGNEQIDCQRKVLMPGLINAHTHAPMTLLRGLADDLRLDVWLMGYIMPVEREFVSPDFVQLGTKIACGEMIRSGVTCFADMYYFEEDVAKATVEAGMRAICNQTILKFPTPDAKSYEESLGMARDFITKWKNHPLIIPSVAPHAPYTCTPEILLKTSELSIEFDVPLHIHISETFFEVDNMRKEHGMPVIPYVKKQGLLEAKITAAHCVHIDEGEMRTMIHAGVGVAHNPSSNMKLASGIAPVTQMINLGLKVGIGTDGPASNNDLDMFEEMRLASFLAKVSTGDPTALPASVVLLMATRMGAQSLHIDHLVGSLEEGKRADLILVNISPLHNTPRFSRDPKNVYAQIIYASKSTDVTDVMVNGKWLMQNNNLLTLNIPDLLYASRDYANKMDAFLVKRESSVLSKLIAIGGATEEESFEVQAKVVVMDIQRILLALRKSQIEIIRFRHYHEYDTYFYFDDPAYGSLRYREDHFVESDGNVSSVRSRLTHIGEASIHHFPQKVILSRSRFLAPATQSLRFYREYFKPSHETEIEKDRLRYLIKFKDTEFFINIDKILKPDLGNFLEVKCRTWSRSDAEQKSLLAVELVAYLEAQPDQVISKDYFEMINE